MRIYISGPMTGMPNYNFERFDAAKKRLSLLGFEVVSPADLERQGGEKTYQDKIKRDIHHLLDCDAVYMLDGWQKSKGAMLEFCVATFIGLKIFYEQEV